MDPDEALDELLATVEFLKMAVRGGKKEPLVWRLWAIELQAFNLRESIQHGGAIPTTIKEP